MRILVIIAILSISANFAFAECTNYMQAFIKHQLVIKGMMDLNFQGKMNAEVGALLANASKKPKSLLMQGSITKPVKGMTP